MWPSTQICRLFLVQKPSVLLLNVSPRCRFRIEFLLTEKRVKFDRRSARRKKDLAVMSLVHCLLIGIVKSTTLNLSKAIHSYNPM